MIKDTDIHSGLSEKIIRDLFATEIVKNTIHNKTPTYNSEIEDPLEKSIQYIKYAKKQIKRFETLKGITNIMQEKGWQEYDLSDYIIKTGKLCRSFIGSEKELIIFCKMNNIDHENII